MSRQTGLLPIRSGRARTRFISLCAAGALLCLLLPAFGAAQDLGELARQERARKQEQPRKSTYVYSEDDLARQQILAPGDKDRFAAARKSQSQQPLQNDRGADPVYAQQTAPLDSPQGTPQQMPLGDIARLYRAQKQAADARPGPYAIDIAPALASPVGPAVPPASPIQPIQSERQVRRATSLLVEARKVATQRSRSVQIESGSPATPVLVAPDAAQNLTVDSHMAPPETQRVRLQSLVAAGSKPPAARRELPLPVPLVLPVASPASRAGVGNRHAIVGSRNANSNAFAATRGALRNDEVGDDLLLPDNSTASDVNASVPAVLQPSVPDISAGPPALAPAEPLNSVASVRMRSGDTLWALARRFLGAGSQWHQLMAANPALRDPRRIPAGSLISLGGRNAAYSNTDRQVVVAPGDSLWKLAQLYTGQSSEWSCVAARNGLASPLGGNRSQAYRIVPGQVLSIPGDCRTAGRGRVQLTAQR